MFIKKFFELFDFKNWQLITKNNQIFLAEFYVNDIHYQCSISNFNTIKKSWQIAFYKIDTDLKVYVNLTSDYTSKNANKVFSNVIDIVDSFIKEYNPNLLIWISEEYDRNNLYERFGKLLNKKYGFTYGFKFLNKQTSDCLYYATKYNIMKTMLLVQKIKKII